MSKPAPPGNFDADVALAGPLLAGARSDGMKGRLGGAGGGRP
jgi:hypothetical protein